MKQFTRARPERPIELRSESGHLERASQALSDATSRTDRLTALSVILSLGLTAYLAIEPTQNWLLLLLAGLAALGTDAVVRSHPHSHYQRVDDTALHLFVPVLFTLGVGIFLEDVVGGYWTVGVGLLSAAAFWAILRAEYESLDRSAEHYQSARLVLNLATYVVAFLFFATIYDFGLDLAAASFAAGTISFLLAIEVLREEGMDIARTMTFALAIGLLMAQAAFSVHFLPLESSAGAVFLLVAFYLMTGLMHNYLANRLNNRTAAEFVGVALAGVAIIGLSHAYY